MVYPLSRRWLISSCKNYNIKLVVKGETVNADPNCPVSKEIFSSIGPQSGAMYRKQELHLCCVTRDVVLDNNQLDQEETYQSTLGETRHYRHELYQDIQYNIVQGDTFLKDLLRYPLAREGVYAPAGPVCIARAMQKFNYIVGLRPYGQHFLLDLNFKKCCNGLYRQFRQSFARETFSYDEMLKSQNIEY